MAVEKFSIIAIEETGHWAEGLLEDHGIEGAFGYYLIRHGERTHICSFTPNSWCYFIRNDFVYDSDNEAAHEWAGDRMYEGGESDYFGFMDPESMDPRFIAETFTVEVPDDLTPEGRETAEYHEAIWEQAQEAAHEFDCNGLWADINNLWTYRQYQRERALKRQGMNEPVLAQGRTAEYLPLFYAAADRMGVKSYEQAREIGWL
jgi:hypothetical protein